MKRRIKLAVHDFLSENFNLSVRFQHPRPFNAFLQENYGSGSLTGVEIGVARGKNSEEILEMLPVEKLYLVDPYDGSGDYWQDPENEVQRALAEAKQRLEPYKDRIEWVRKTSSEAASSIPDDLDFVYIDGNHEYGYVKQDIENYWPKIREGGAIGGHNLEIDGVTKAVWEFSRERERPPQVMCKGTTYTDWVFVKQDEE